MKQKIKFFRVLFFVALLVFMAPVILSPSFAQTRSENTCPDGMQSQPVSGICIPASSLPNTPIEVILLNFMYWILGIFGFLAVISFVIAGIQYILAAGNPDAAKRAKQNVMYSIIGIVVALSGLIVIYAVSGFLEGYGFF